MITIALNEEQLLAMIDLLECALSDLKTEIIHTDNHDLKEMLKHRKSMLVELQATLQDLIPLTPA